MNAVLGAAQWMVGKARAHIADGVLKAWAACESFGPNVEALTTELLLVQVTLENASCKQLGGQAMEKLLQKLRDSAHNAEDLLDELDYFRIHDELHDTYDAADEHAKGGVHNLVLNACHTAKAVGKQLLGDPRPRPMKRARGNSSSAPNASQADEEVSGRMLPYSSFPPVDAIDETPKLGFNRVHVSKRMENILEQLRPVRRALDTIQQSCDRKTVHSRPNTIGRSIEPKLYGRDHTVNSIIHDITKGKYCGKDLTVLPIFGPGGIGKTTLMQHIYQNKEVQNHFQVKIWVCVSFTFDLNKLLEEIKECIPEVEGEKKGRPEELIEQRLKSKRFLLVLDDIWECSNGEWECSNGNGWDRLLMPLKTSQEKGSMILLTTRFQAIAQMVKTTNHPIQLEGLEFEEFRKLFLAFVFDDEQCRKDHTFLLETGDKIMAKLKGSPLAAKTVGRLLRKDLSLLHWRRILENKEWGTQTSNNDIMPALKLSFDHLPFHQQQCFSYSALFPEDYLFSSTELINFWIGLDFLQPGARNQTFEDIGLSNLNDLVTHGFFREEKTDDSLWYVMHDLLHDLALKVASHECLSLHRSNVQLIQIQPCIRHLSIIIDDVGHDNAVSGEKFKSELRKLKTQLKVEHLQTLMLFGRMDESFAKFLGDLFTEATALRVLHLPEAMSYSVESILHNFSMLIHLRYLHLGGGGEGEVCLSLPLAISRFYHLRILDLTLWYGSCNLPKDMSNLAKLCHFDTLDDELHSNIYNVGKLELLEELKVFQVNKKSEGFELKQLEHLTKLRELGIYNLEKVHTEEEAAKAKLVEKNYLERLTLCWDSNAEPDIEAMVLESLQPHRNLKVLCIRGHKGSSCPSWLGDELAVEALQSLHLIRVSWEVFPSLGRMWDLRELRLEYIVTMKEFVIKQSFCRLIRLELVGLNFFDRWIPPQDAHLFPLLQVLIIRDCPKLLELPFSNHIVCPPEQDCNIDLFPKLEELEIENCGEFLLVVHIPWTETLCSVSIRHVKLLEELLYSDSPWGPELEIIGKPYLHSLDQVLVFNKETCLEKVTLKSCPPLGLKHLLMLTSLKILDVYSSDALVGPLGGQSDVEWQLPVEILEVGELSGAIGRELTELLLHLPRLQELALFECPELILPDGHNENTGGFQALRSLQTLRIEGCCKLLSAWSFSSPSCRLFPSSLQNLELSGIEGMETLEPLSNLTSVTRLEMDCCGEDLRCEGLLPLLTTGGQLSELEVLGSPRFFLGWNHNLRRVLPDEEGEEQQLQFLSPLGLSTLQELRTDEAVGLLATPVCGLLSSSLTKLSLDSLGGIEFFTKEEEDALHLLTSLQELIFNCCYKLQHLPAGLHKLTNLKRLEVCGCDAVRSLPGLPTSLQELDVHACRNKDLKQYCRGLVGTIPKIRLD